MHLHHDGVKTKFLCHVLGSDCLSEKNSRSRGGAQMQIWLQL